jgi:hypothetical protein
MGVENRLCLFLMDLSRAWHARIPREWCVHLPHQKELHLATSIAKGHILDVPNLRSSSRQSDIWPTPAIEWVCSLDDDLKFTFACWFPAVPKTILLTGNFLRPVQSVSPVTPKFQHSSHCRSISNDTSKLQIINYFATLVSRWKIGRNRNSKLI